MHLLAILLVAAAAASIQYGPGYGGQPNQPSQPSHYPPSYPYPQPAPLPYPLPYGDEGHGVPRCRNCRQVRAFKDDATLAYGTVLIKERTLGRCTVSIVTCKGEEGQTFTLIDEKKRTLARGSHIRHKIVCMGGKRWKTKNADNEKVVFTKLACVVDPVTTTVEPSTTDCKNCKTIEFVNATGFDCGEGKHSVCAADEIDIEFDEQFECAELPKNQKQRAINCPDGYDTVVFLQNKLQKVVTDGVSCNDARKWVHEEKEVHVEKMTCRRRCTACGINNLPLSKNCPASSECTAPVLDTTKSCLRLRCPSQHRMRLDNSQKSDIGPELWYSPEIPLAVCNGSSFVTKFDLPITCEKVDCTPFSDTCDQGWTKFGHACFKFFDAPMTWTAAEAKCNSLRSNSHLTSIHNAEENAFIYEHLKYANTQGLSWQDNAWLGMRQVDSEDFQWSNGQIVNYSNWKSGEPNNLFSPGNQVEDCTQLLLLFNVGEWNDFYCHVTNAKHVCRYNLKDDACFE